MFYCKHGKSLINQAEIRILIKKYTTDKKNGLNYTRVNGVFLTYHILPETSCEISYGD